MVRWLSRAASRILTKRAAAVALMVALLLSLVPILVLAGYNRPAADDISYCITTHRVWEQTHSIFAVIGTAAQNAIGVYWAWQGSFSACFLMSLQPGLFSERLYAVGTWMLVLVFLATNALFFRSFVHDLLGFDRGETAILYALAMFCCLQLLPSAAEGFFWYNGAAYYTLFFSISEILAACLYRSAAKRDGSFHARHILAPLSAFVLGGGNYVTGLTAAVLLALYLGVLRHKKRLDSVALLSAAAFFAGLLLNIIAPGNAVRQSGINGLDPARAILFAVANAARCLGQWLSIPLALGGLLSAPLLFKRAGNLAFRFPYPLLVPAGSVLLIAVGFTPPFYATGGVFGLRIYNVQYFEFVLLFFGNIFYFLGWSQRVVRESGRGWREALHRYVPAYCLALLLLFGLQAASSRYPIYRRSDILEYTSVSAAHSL